MGQKITISELAIKVRLDSKSATAGLKNLERKLKTFQHYINSQLNTEKMKTAALHAQINAKGRSLALQKKLNRESKKGVNYARQTANLIKGAMVGTVAFRFISGIRDIIQDITMSGMGVNQSTASLNAAVGASKPASGMDQKEVMAMSERQRKFALGTAKKYGQNVAGGTAQYAKFFAAASGNLGEEGVMHMYTSLSKLGVVYGMTGEKMERAMTAFTQMASKNQVMAEELKQQLGDVLPGAMEIFARALTKTAKFGVVDVKKLYELMEDGKIIASEVFTAVGDEMSRMAEANGALDAAMATTAAKWNVMKSTATIFKTSALNQFNVTLGSIVTKITTLFEGRGLAAALGQMIDKGMLVFEGRFDKIIEQVSNFEKDFEAAVGNEAKMDVIDKFFTTDGELMTSIKDMLLTTLNDVATFFGEALAGVLNSLTLDNLKGFVDTMILVVGAIMDGVLDGFSIFGAKEKGQPMYRPDYSTDGKGDSRSVASIISQEKTNSLFNKMDRQNAKKTGDVTVVNHLTVKTEELVEAQNTIALGVTEAMANLPYGRGG